MKLTVFRFYQPKDKDGYQTKISSYYAIREYIENLTDAQIIEEDFVEVDESDLDIHGRIPAI